MFRGINSIVIDAKGRAAVPARHRELLSRLEIKHFVITLNPWDRCLWLYPLDEWELIESKLSTLSDFDKESRRTKQVIRGYASDCVVDNQGRVLVPSELRDFAKIEKHATFLGQGNKFEIWEEEHWSQVRDNWFEGVNIDDPKRNAVLTTLSL